MQLDYQTPSRPEDVHQRRRTLIVRVVLALVAAVVIACMLIGLQRPSGGKSRETALRVKCVRNLKAVGQAIQQYANANGGQLPPSLVALAIDQRLTCETFICPSGTAEHLTASTLPVESASQTVFETTHENRSYDYALPIGRTASLSTLQWDDVLLVELPENHDYDGVYVLLADGSVDWVNRDSRGKVNQLLDDLKSGVWPLRVK